MSAPKKIIFVKKTAVKPEGSKASGDRGSEGEKEKSVLEGLPRLTTPKYTIEFSDHRLERKEPKQESKKEKEYSQFNPFFAQVQDAQYVSSKASSKRVIQITVDITGSDMHYLPGDYIEILCSNPPLLVDAIIAKLNLNPDLFINIQQRTKNEENKATENASQQQQQESLPFHLNVKTVRDLFLHSLDITSPPSKKLLRVMAEFCENEDEKNRLLTLCSIAGRQEYHNLVEDHPTFFDLVTLFPTCNIPLYYIIELLPPLTPREYSISSSPLITPNLATFVFSVIDYISENKKHVKGLCSTWLENIVSSFLIESTSLRILQLNIENKDKNKTEEVQTQEIQSSSSEGIFIPLYIKATPQFHLPIDSSVPIIMVGPGTGVAPFLGFIDHRKALQNNESVLGECWLFFGCQHSASDYITIRKKLESYLPPQSSLSGTPLTHLITSFSRDQEEVIYVQHKLEEFSSDIVRIMMEANGIFYLCGDIKGMVKSVRETLIKILDSKKIQGELQFNEWIKEKRFISEAWF